MTSRRAFLAGVGALGAAISVRAQSAPRRLGWVCYAPPGAALVAFRDGMAALGYSGAREVGIEVRVVENNGERVKAVVDELIAQRVAVIVTQAAVSPLANRLAAGRVPVVFAFSGDPVIAGMAESFASPGGNTTGMSFLALELVGKRFEVMRELEPAVRRVAILANPFHAGEGSERQASLNIVKAMGLESEYVQLKSGEDPQSAFDQIRRARVQGLVVFQDAGMVARAPSVAQFAIKEKLIATSGWSQFAHAGFVASYGPNLNAVFRHLAQYVDRILKGARAGELPVELPTRIELVINLRSARALGLNVPQSVLLRADEVIQ